MCCATCQHFHANPYTLHLTCLVQLNRPGTQYQLKYSLSPDHCCNLWERRKGDPDIDPEIEQIITDLHHYLQGLMEADPRGVDDISEFAFWMSENSNRVHVAGRFDGAFRHPWRLACRPEQASNVEPAGPVALARQIRDFSYTSGHHDQSPGPCGHCLREMPGFDLAYRDLQDLAELLEDVDVQVEEPTVTEVQTGLW